MVWSITHFLYYFVLGSAARKELFTGAMEMLPELQRAFEFHQRCGLQQKLYFDLYLALRQVHGNLRSEGRNPNRV
jgi:hypothetical protein